MVVKITFQLCGLTTAHVFPKRYTDIEDGSQRITITVSRIVALYELSIITYKRRECLCECQCVAGQTRLPKAGLTHLQCHLVTPGKHLLSQLRWMF